MKQTIFALALVAIFLSPFLWILGSFVKYEWMLYRAKKRCLADCDVNTYCNRLTDMINKIDESHTNGYTDTTLEVFVQIFGEEHIKSILNRHLSESKKINKVI
jgi:hypothetical protein